LSLCLHRFATLQAVILMQIAGRPKRLVVQVERTRQLLQLLREHVNRMQLSGRRGNLKLRNPNEFLVAAVQKTPHLASNHHSRTHRIGRRRILRSGSHQHRPGPVLRRQHPAWDLR